ncbi:MAG: hypothetical protein V8S81_06935 [Oscillospiraceae bacterium]
MYKAIRLFNYKDGIGLEQDALRGVCEVEEHVCTTEDEIISACQDADAVMGIFEPLTARVIHSLPKLKLIACKSMGYNYVDLEAAKECGVSVTHLKSAFSIDVADYVTACILAHNKRLFAYDRSVRADKKWDYSVCPDIHRRATRRSASPASARSRGSWRRTSPASACASSPPIRSSTSPSAMSTASRWST